MRFICLAMVLTLTGCDAGHLGNPALWPGMAVGSGIENASYNARRKQVQGHVTAHQGEILADIRTGNGPALTKAMDLARVPVKIRAGLVQMLKQDIAKFTPDTPHAREQLVVWLMVHGG